MQVAFCLEFYRIILLLLLSLPSYRGYFPQDSELPFPTVPPMLFPPFLILRFTATILRSTRSVARIHHHGNHRLTKSLRDSYIRATFHESIATGWSKGFTHHTSKTSTHVMV